MRWLLLKSEAPAPIVSLRIDVLATDKDQPVEVEALPVEIFTDAAAADPADGAAIAKLDAVGFVAIPIEYSSLDSLMSPQATAFK